MSKQTTPRKRPASKAQAPAASKSSLKLVGFYVDPATYADAVTALNLDAETVTDFLIDQLTRKAGEVRGRSRDRLVPRKVTELELARRLGKNRTTVAAMRARGDLDGTFEVKGNGRIVYDLAAVASKGVAV